tara:strand:- start:77 stop:256 length:180 start_codon:yes stop_codon:yes gene_type:complete
MIKTEIVTTCRCFKKVKKGIEKLSIHPYLMFIRSRYYEYVGNHGIDVKPIFAFMGMCIE